MAEFFADINLAKIGIQLIGFLAMAIDCVSFQAKKRNNILLLQMTGCALWVLQMVLLGGYTGAAVNLLAVARAAVFMQKDKHRWASSHWVLAAAIAAFILAGALTYESPLSLLPTGAMIISTVALYMSDEKKIRILSLFMIPMWFVYDYTMGSIAGVTAEIMNLTSIIAALIRYRKKDNDS